MNGKTNNNVKANNSVSVTQQAIVSITQQEEALAKSMARNKSNRVIDAQKKGALGQYKRIGAGEFKAEDLGIARDPFLSAVAQRVEELAAQEGMVVSTLFLEDFALSSTKALPLTWAGVSAEFESETTDADFVLIAGARNDDTAWGELEDLAYMRGFTIDYGILDAFVNLTYLDGLDYIETTLISERSTDGRSLWLLDVRESGGTQFPMVADVSAKAIAAVHPDLNFRELTREGTPEFEDSAQFLAELVWKRPYTEGLTTFFDAVAYHKNANGARKLFMGLDEFKFDAASIEPFAIVPDEN